MSNADFPAIESLVPHRGASLLLDRVIEHDPETTTSAIAVASRRGWRGNNGSVPAWLAVEYMAQGAAAHEGMRARAENRTLPLGFLVSVRALQLTRAEFQADEVLHVVAQRRGGRPGLGALSHACKLFACKDGRERELVAEGRFSISIPRSSADPGSRAAGPSAGDRG